MSLDRRTLRHLRTPNAGDTPAARWLAAGIPLTLLLDLAAGDALDSREILAQEQVAALVTEEGLARAGGADRGERDTGIA